VTAGPGERERQFEQLFRDHRQALLRYAARRVGSDRAEDVVADAFVVAWRRLGEVPADHQRGWLFGVASRVIANEVRSVGRRLLQADCSNFLQRTGNSGVSSLG
jgi:RNA polymerase sigma-70 factor (ECF subfamily)